VSILRRNIERNAQDHAAQLAKLKAAKEQADANQAQMKKEMKEEMERLRTQFLFKQHELESSTRVAPFSARANKISKALHSPAPIPQQRGWGRNESSKAGPSNTPGEVFNHLQIPVPVNGSPRLQRTLKKEHLKSIPHLPGFENAFVTSPVRSQARKFKGKERMIDEILVKKEQTTFLQFPSHFMSGNTPPMSPPSSPTRPRPRDGQTSAKMNDLLIREADGEELGDVSFSGTGNDDGDIEMSDQVGDAASEEVDEFEPINWNEELSRVLLTHTLPTSPSLSFQALLSVAFPESFSDTSKSAYSSACASILEKVGSASKFVDCRDLFDTISASLSQMVHILHMANEVSAFLCQFYLSS
jgi:hypothetical protein